MTSSDSQWFTSVRLDEILCGTVELSVPLRDDVIQVSARDAPDIATVRVWKGHRAVTVTRVDGRPVQVEIAAALKQFADVIGVFALAPSGRRDTAMAHGRLQRHRGTGVVGADRVGNRCTVNHFPSRRPNVQAAGEAVPLATADRRAYDLRMCADTKVCRFGPESPYVDLAAEVLRLVSDPTRIRIILALRDHGELSVNRLAELVGKTPTATSQHLAKLRWGRVVGVRQDGARMFYQLVDDQARELVALAVFQAERALGQGSAHERAGLPPGAAGIADGGCPAAGRSTPDDGTGDDEDES